MVIDGDIDEDLDIVGEALAGDMLEVADAEGAFAPGLGRYFCQEGAGTRVFFHQVKMMIVLIGLEGMACHVRDDPEVTIPEDIIQRRGDMGGELGETYGGR